MIHEEICTYEVCKLAKKKGFPQDVFGTCEMKSSCYLEDGRYYKDGCIYPVENAYSAPTQSLLQRWLREENGIQISIDSDLDFDDETFVYEWQIANKENFDNGGFEIHRYNSEESHSTYESALEDALKYALENLV